MRNLGLALVMLLVAGCAGSDRPIIVAAPGPSVSTSSTGPASGGGFRPPAVQQDSSLDLVIGQRADRLTQLFGPARLDLTEGDARKLQFADETCVLDIYLYPLNPSQPPVATHVEARRPQDGSAVDRGRCISALRR